MFFNENALRNKLQTFKNRIWTFLDELVESKEEKLKEEKRLDQELKDTFPASDPIGHSPKREETFFHH